MMINEELFEEDEALFEFMKSRYVSENEKEFFEKLHEKEVNEFTFANDLILSEDNNEDEIYIVRCEFEEYIVGRAGLRHEEHVMCLDRALKLNLKSCGFLDRDITLFDWLRERDYVGVEYDHNYDDI